MKDLSLKKDDEKDVSANTEMADLKAQIAVLQAALDKTKKVEEPDKDVEMTTIHIDLAAGAGLAINHAGQQFRHGLKYTVDVNTARDVMEIVHRGHAQEYSMQNTENMGRRSQSRRI